MVNFAATVTIAAVLFWTISNILGKRVSQSVSRGVITLLLLLFGMIPIGIIMLTVGAGSVGSYSIAIALIAGVFGAFGFILYYKALHTEQLTNAVVLSEMQSAILVLFGIFVLGQPVSSIQILCILLIFIGALFVITSEKLKINKRLLPAVLANASWAVYWILMTYSVSSSKGFVLPITISRLSAIAVVVLYLLIFARPIKMMITRKGKYEKNVFLFVIALIAIIGFADAIGDTLFAYVVGLQSLTIGGAVSALSPVLISIVAYFVYKDRLTKLQALGFAIMVLGALILSLL